MAVLIGNAAIDENSKSNSGKSGDQTGKEVRTRQWYNGNWHTLIRCNDPEKAEIMARECEKMCANENIGYDQWQRNTLRKEAKSNDWDLSKVGKCECDCSSGLVVCAECAGIEIPYHNGNAPTTSTMEDDFEATNEFSAYRDEFYLDSDKYLKRGDILVKVGHCVMVLENGEFATRNYYPVEIPVLKKGFKGEDVRALQGILKAFGYELGEIDGSFGNKTENAVKKFQEDRGLDTDGSVGPATWNAILGK